MTSKYRKRAIAFNPLESWDNLGDNPLSGGWQIIYFCSQNVVKFFQSLKNK